MNLAILGPSDTLHLRRLVRGLVARGHRVHVVSMKAAPIEGATFERFAVPRFGFSYPYRWRRRWEQSIGWLFDQFDVVTVHFLSDWGITPQAVESGRLIVRTYGSDVDHPEDVGDPPAELVATRQRLVRWADQVVAPSHWFARKVADFSGLDASDVTVIPDGVDVTMFSPRSSPPRSTRVVGFFKGFKPVYSPMTLIEAIPLVRQRCPDVLFEIVGSGFLRDACRRRADELEVLDAIRWIEHRTHEAMPGLIAGWDVVAITSLKESLCVAALEAQAMEVPVVATRVGGLGEAVLHERTGLLVEPKNPQALSQAIVTLLDDPERRRAMGSEGRRHVVENFEWNDYLDRWISLYQSVREGKIETARSPVLTDR